MSEKYYSPDASKNEYTCPYCEVFAHQIWNNCIGSNPMVPIEGLKISNCAHCGSTMIWYMEKPIYPSASHIPMPHHMMPKVASEIYLEARAIAEDSPRAAAALLRLALEILLREIGGNGSDINYNIGKLLKEKKISPKVQQSCDILRVIGNNAVHPGTIAVDDDLDIARSIFGLINFIVKETIENPFELDKLYNNLPERAKKGIENRDKSTILTGKTS